NTFTPELALGSAKAVAKDIVESANAHYGGKDRIADLERKLKRAHDTMADLHRDWTREEARAEKAEADLSYYKTASKNFEDAYWEAYEEAAQDAAYVHELTDRAEASEEYVRELSAALKKANKRAEAAEARLKDADWKLKKSEMQVKTAEDRLKEVDSDRWGLLNRAEDAEARAKELERQLFDMEGRRTARELGLKKRVDKAEARVRELEAENARLERALRDEISKEARQVFGVDDAPDIFTAPDGRVFRVGQRVWHIWDEPGEFGHVTDINGGFPLVQFQDSEDQTHPDNLRRVWDGSEEPNVPVGTVLRDSY